MLRYFVSPHPTFGSYANPIAWRVEASPYFWWWRALGWAQQQQTSVEGSFRGADRVRWEAVRECFGVVEVGENVHKSFCDWWRHKMPNGEERGVYLFAEPVLERKTVELTEWKQTRALLDDEHYILMAVPKDVQLSYARQSVDRILKRHDVRKEGRKVRDPKHSKARYHLSKSVQVESLRKAFRLYEHQLEAVTKGESVTNVELARRAGIKHQSKAKDQVMDKAARNRNLGIIVSRHLKMARDAVGRVQLGMFP